MVGEVLSSIQNEMEIFQKITTKIVIQHKIEKQSALNLVELLSFLFWG